MQCDFDTIGTRSSAADIETALVIHDLMRAVGFDDFTIRVNNRLVLSGLLERIGLAEQSTHVLRALDKLGKIGPEKVAAEMEATAGATAQQAGDVLKLAALSGGNAQKLILAREVDADASLIIAAQPTRGLDVGATAFVWKSLREARARGCGVLLISSDLDELFDISDRIVVMLSGRIAGEFTPPYSLADVGAAMTGVGR